MKNIIIKSNSWFDTLSDTKRTLFFLVAICGSFLIVQIVSNFILKTPWPTILWLSGVSFWRLSYFRFKK